MSRKGSFPTDQNVTNPDNIEDRKGAQTFASGGAPRIVNKALNATGLSKVGIDTVVEKTGEKLQDTAKKVFGTKDQKNQVTLKEQGKTLQKQENALNVQRNKERIAENKKLLKGSRKGAVSILETPTECLNYLDTRIAELGLSEATKDFIFDEVKSKVTYGQGVSIDELEELLSSRLVPMEDRQGSGETMDSMWSPKISGKGTRPDNLDSIALDIVLGRKRIIKMDGEY